MLNTVRTAWNQGFRNALVRAAGLVIVYVAISGIIAAVTGRRFVDSFGIAFMVFSAVVLLIFVGTWLVARNVGGRVLLDCGPYPTRGLSIVCAVLFLIGGAMIALRATSRSAAFAITAPLFINSFSIYYLIMASGSIQVRENGLWGYWGLIRWSSISSFTWAEDGTLLLTGKGPISFLRRALPVPREYQQAVEKLLIAHLQP